MKIQKIYPKPFDFANASLREYFDETRRKYHLSLSKACILIFLYSCIFIFLCSCSSKMTYPPNQQYMEENRWQQVVIFPAPKKIDSPIPEGEQIPYGTGKSGNDKGGDKSGNDIGRFHLDSYGYFDFYIGFLAKEIKFNPEKHQIIMKNAFLFANNLPVAESFFNRSILRIPYKKHKLPIDVSVNKNCERYKVIIIHKEAVKYWEDWIWAYKCFVNDDGSIRYEKLYDNQYFTVNNWDWYNIVFRNYNMDIK